MRRRGVCKTTYNTNFSRRSSVTDHGPSVWTTCLTQHSNAVQHTAVLPSIPSGPLFLLVSFFFSVSLVVKRSVCSLVEGVTTSCQCRCVMAGLFSHPFLCRPTERCKVVKANPLLHMKVRKQKAAAEGAARMHMCLCLCESKK